MRDRNKTRVKMCVTTLKRNCCVHCTANKSRWGIRIKIYLFLLDFYTCQKSTEGLVESTDSNSVPTGGYSKASDKQIWIAVSLGLAGLVLIIIIVITVFLWLKCRRNCKQERTGT